MGAFVIIQAAVKASTQIVVQLVNCAWRAFVYTAFK